MTEDITSLGMAVDVTAAMQLGEAALKQAQLGDKTPKIAPDSRDSGDNIIETESFDPNTLLDPTASIFQHEEIIDSHSSSADASPRISAVDDKLSAVTVSDDVFGESEASMQIAQLAERRSASLGRDDEDSSPESSSKRHSRKRKASESKQKKKPRSRPASAPASESSSALPSPLIDGADSSAGVIMGLGKEKGTYYCKYCDTSWPYHHFRNAQQFGAHCSNCSRKRKVKDPQEMTIRERNKRKARKTKAGSSPSSATKKEKSTPRHSEGESEDEDLPEEEEEDVHSGNEREDAEASTEIPSGSAMEIDSAATSAKENAARAGNSRPGSRRASIGGTSPQVRSSPRLTTPRISRAGSHPPEDIVQVLIPDTQIPQSEIIDDPNSIGGLLQALEERISQEKKRKEVEGMKQRVHELREALLSQQEVGLSSLRLNFKSRLQELGIQVASKIESLKLEIASELSFREIRRRKQLDELRKQMNHLEQSLRRGSEERKSIADSGSFALALSQLDELRIKVMTEISTRETALQQQVTDLRSSYSSRLEQINQQMHKELTLHDERVEKDLEEMKTRLHTGINVWQNNFGQPSNAMNDYGSPRSAAPGAASGARSLGGLPATMQVPHVTSTHVNTSLLQPPYSPSHNTFSGVIFKPNNGDLSRFSSSPLDGKPLPSLSLSASRLFINSKMDGGD